MSAVMRRILAPDSICVDVGANTGRTLSLMLEIAPRGKHYAFEPIPYLAANLRRLCPTVSVHACALSDTEEVATFAHVVNVPGWSGLRGGDYPDQAR